MTRGFWLVYVVLYVAFSTWAVWRLPDPVFISLTDLITFAMLIGIIGLALRKRLISQALWKIASVVGGLMFIHSWLVMPAIYIANDLGWREIAVIQTFALPSLPIFIGLYVYAWHSKEIWE